jgi:hypothetical protein
MKACAKEFSFKRGWVEKGLVKIQADGHEVCVKAGQSFFTAPGTRRQWFKAGTRLLSVGFRCQWPDGSPLHKAELNVVMSQADVKLPFMATNPRFTELAQAVWFSVYVSTLEASQPQAD